MVKPIHRITPSEVKSIIEWTGLTIPAFASLLGHDQRTVRRWLHGERAIPPTAAIVMHAIADNSIRVSRLAPRRSEQSGNRAAQ